MFYYLFDFLDSLDVPGAGMFKYISFRSAMAIITSLIISLLFGKRIINYLRRKQVGEVVRDLGLEEFYRKKGTPSMGGIIILASIIIPTLLFGDLGNVYVILMLVTTIWLGFVGFLDDYIKIFKKNKKGLAGKFKIMGQVILGLVVSVTMYLSDDVFVRERIEIDKTKEVVGYVEQGGKVQEIPAYVTRDVKSTKTTIPFV
ncbi:MAG: phospho-N-acetylmuramoyl-pentapeptide-transferase, partial [Bacteroidales bacterium]|nr:phospho-N-acetylmuramoyl-pentapeptide-transferase [Bacteroidales bacterium]